MNDHKPETAQIVPLSARQSVPLSEGRRRAIAAQDARYKGIDSGYPDLYLYGKDAVIEGGLSKHPPRSK